ncbi:hypothetical protein F511_05764 [Dorcoceras hygrometricum]|uniref:Uncharacterized protein n=1 Tax=Dorcoceras hygrometricum TaxID=472368 RepID=A0A2Z7AAP1_9LAMI|nr:hypothetical protein F511_05764 [Dorcoceras hygrometricum]
MVSIESPKEDELSATNLAPNGGSPNDVALESRSNKRISRQNPLAHPDLVKSEIIKPHRPTPTHEPDRSTQCR